ncbi:hypothetical protein ABIC29_000839 [Agromyces sp. PvR057]
MQAYALQEVLRQLGADAVTDVSRSDRPDGLRSWGKILIKSGVCRVPVLQRFAPIAWHRQLIRRDRARPIRPFVAAKIRTVRIYRGRRPRLDELSDVTLYLVGSDQVWRNAYADVRSYLFDFAPDGAKMASYAASFGRDNLDEYPSQLVEDSRALAQRFEAISVREAEAISLCRDHWGVDAVQHIDPTLLLTVDHYQEISGPSADNLTRKSNVLSYMLDPTIKTGAYIDYVARVLELRRCDLLPPRPARAKSLRPDAAGVPTVHGWLRAFGDASFVVTDSFHGTVFALLNGKPFITLVNEFRGVSRLSSLLNLVGLADRLLVDASEEDIDATLSRAIDWADVNRRLEQERARGRDYLASLVAWSRSSHQRLDGRCAAS